MVESADSVAGGVVLRWLSEEASECCWARALLRIGTKADLTTSMCSSSESSEEFSCVDVMSREELILLWECVDGGLEEDGRDEAGERCAELRWSAAEVDIGGVFGE